MKHTFVILLLTGTLWAAQASLNQVTTEPWEKILGTWKLVPGSDGPTTTKIEPESGGGIKISFGCKQDGSCPSSISVNYDGKLYKYSDYSDAAKNEASFQKIGDRTIQQGFYFNGKQRSTSTWQLSPDGNTLTITSQVVSPPGSKKITSVYDRNGGPASNDDPLVGLWKRDWNKSDARVITYTRKGGIFTFTGPDGITSTRNCDGKDHPDTTSSVGGLYSCRFPDERTYELVVKENGGVVRTGSTKISEDGKKNVRIWKNGEGKTTLEETYEKIK